MEQLLLMVDNNFLNNEYYGEQVSSYLWFLGIIIATLLLKKTIANLVTRFSGRLTSKLSYINHKRELLDLLMKPVERLLEVVLFYVAFNQISDALDKVVIYHSISKKGTFILKLGDVAEHLFLFLFIVFLTQVITHIVDFIYHLNLSKANSEKNQARLQLLPLIKELSKLVIWSLSAFWILGSVFHVNVPALITGLGIGGVAIALAGKETVENFIAAFTILSDKPFQVGEHIKLNEMEGIVERIGFRSTLIRLFDGSAIIVPNQKLVSQNLINLSNRHTQGVKIAVNTKYGPTQQQLTELIQKLFELLRSSPQLVEPIDVSVDISKPDAMQINIGYHLPFPLPDGVDLLAIKRETGLKVYGVISQYATIGGNVASVIDQ